MRISISKSVLMQMRCSTASVTVCLSICSRSRMRQCAFWWQLANATTSQQSFVAYTGFQWSSGSTTSWPFSSTVAARSSSTVPGRWLPADHGLQTPPASLRSHQHPHCSENKHLTWRQEFLGRGSENLEQSTRLTAATWHWIWTL